MATITDGLTLPVPRASVELAAVLTGSEPVGIALQPIVDLQRGELVGFEALARFGSARNRLPGPWLSRARDSGDLPALEALLLQAALAARETLPAGAFLAVNVSPNLLSHPKVRAVLRGAGDLSSVVLECTEHEEFGDLGALRRELGVLRARGLRLALDDVGAGWSGLRQIAELGPDIVKVDRSLVTEVDRDPVKGALLELLVAFTSRLGGLLLVEGVERYEEIDFSARLGVALAQGFVVGRPALRPHSPDDDLLTRVKFRAGTNRHSRLVVAHLDVTAPVVRIGEAARYPSTGGSGRHTVLVDDQHQPTHLYSVGDGTGRLARISTVQAGQASTAALRMAMTRDGMIRFDPLACVDKAGRFLGLVAVEDLVRAVLADAEAVDQPGPGAA